MNDILSAASVFLATLGLVYSAWYPSLVAARDMALPTLFENRTTQRHELRRIFVGQALPLAFGSAALALVLLPDASRLVAHSWRAYSRDGLTALKHYDAVGTLYCAVVIFAIAFAIHILLLAVTLNATRRRANAR